MNKTITIIVILLVVIPVCLSAQEINLKYKHIVLLDVTGSMLYKGDYPKYRSDGPSENELWTPAMDFIESLINESEDQDEICIIPFRGDNDGKDGIPHIQYCRKEFIQKWEQVKNELTQGQYGPYEKSHYRDGTCIYKPLSRALSIMNNTRDSYCFLYIITDGTETVGNKSDLYRVFNQFRKSYSKYAFYLALPTEKNEYEIKQHLGDIEYVKGLKKFGVIVKPDITIDSSDLDSILMGKPVSFCFSRKQHEYGISVLQNSESDNFKIEGNIISNGILKLKISAVNSKIDISDIMDDIIEQSGTINHYINATINSSDINIINNQINIEIILKESTKVRIESIEEKLRGKDLGTYYYTDSIWGLATPLELTTIPLDTLKASFLSRTGALWISVQSRDNVENSYSVLSDSLAVSTPLILNCNDSVARIALSFNRDYPYEKEDYGFWFWINLINPFNIDRNIRKHDLFFDIDIKVDDVDNIINAKGEKLGKDLRIPYQVQLISQIHCTLFWLVRILEWLLILFACIILIFYIRRKLAPRFPEYARLKFQLSNPNSRMGNIAMKSCLYNKACLVDEGSNILYTSNFSKEYIKEIVITHENVNRNNPEKFRCLSKQWKQWLSQKWNGDVIKVHGYDSDKKEPIIDDVKIVLKGTRFNPYVEITVKGKPTEPPRIDLYKLANQGEESVRINFDVKLTGYKPGSID